MLTSLLYPLQVLNGKLITTSSYPEIVKGVILSTLYTYQDERVWYPEYGNKNYLFSTDVLEVKLGIDSSLANSLQEYPGVVFSTSVLPSDTGRLQVDVYYWVGDNEYQLSKDINGTT